MLVQVIILIASLIISYVTAPKPQNAKPAALSDFDFPQFDEGTPQAVIFGDCWCPDWFVLGYGDFRTTPIHADGGK